MNTSYNPFHMVGTYGAFGSITRVRNEVIVEGTTDAVSTSTTKWREYEFKAKPTALNVIAAANCALSSTYRLADVVCRHVFLKTIPGLSTSSQNFWRTTRMCSVCCAPIRFLERRLSTCALTVRIPFHNA